MCTQKPIRLIVIDSLAGLIRYEYNLQENKEMKERTHYLFAIGQQLKWLSETFHTAIVVVNQVTADFQQQQQLESASSSSLKNNDSIPALGLAWSHCVNTRYVVIKPRRTTSTSYSSSISSSYSSSSYSESSYPSSSSSSVVHYQENKENEENVSSHAYVSERNTKRKLSQVFSPNPTNNTNNTKNAGCGGGEEEIRVKNQFRILRLDFSPVESSKQASFEIVPSGLA